MRRMPLVVSVLVSTCPLAGCQLGSTSPPTSLSVTRIDVSPAEFVTDTGSLAAQPVQFSASVYWSTGEIVADADVAWQSSNQIAGTITEDGLFTPSAENGGVTLITASYLGRTGSTTLTVVFNQDLVEEGLPAGLPEQVDAAPVTIDDDLAPTVLYPYSGVVVPRNIRNFEFQWEPVADRPLTILEFTSATTHTRVFTESDRWTPDPTEWQTLAATNSGGSFSLSARSATLIGEGEDATLEGDVIAPSEAVDVSISRLDATGAIYYWSLFYWSDVNPTLVTGVIKRAGYGDDAATDFYAPHVPQVDDAPGNCSDGVDNDGDGKVDQNDPGCLEAQDTSESGEPICVSCHSISSDGERMSMIYETGRPGTLEFDQRAGLLEVEGDGNYTELVNHDEGLSMAWASFSPDGRYALGLDDFELTLIDAQTWEYLYPIDLGYEYVANPSFSPDGDEVIFTVPSSVDPIVTDGRHFYGGRIAAAAFVDGTFGEPYWVTPLVEGKNQYYPTYSPDGDWIVFTQSTEDPDDSYEGDSDMDLSAELYLVARGGGAPTRLDRLNDVLLELLGPESTEADAVDMGDLTYPPDVANSWPGWGPLPDADLLWLTFSSLRGFGHDVDRGIPQIWVSAIDPEKASAGLDPSSPPFWLTIQDPATHNHIPQWGKL